MNLHRRKSCQKLGKDEKKKVFKTADQLEKEKQDSKWTTSKVLE